MTAALSIQVREQAVARVRAGEAPATVALLLGVKAQTVRKWTQLAGIRRMSRIDRDLFRRPLTPATAWLLGVIVGDGCIVRRCGKIIGVQICGDLDVCQKAARLLRTKAKISLLAGECYGFECGSPPVARSLIALGIKPAKTYTVPWPKIVDSRMAPHFMRGFWDADGSVSRDLLTGNRRPVLTAVSCSKALMREVHRWVREAGTSRAKLATVRPKNRAVKYVSTVTCSKELLLGEWLWANSSEDIRGDRKYKAFCYWQEKWDSRRTQAA